MSLGDPPPGFCSYISEITTQFAIFLQSKNVPPTASKFMCLYLQHVSRVSYPYHVLLSFGGTFLLLWFPGVWPRPAFATHVICYTCTIRPGHHAGKGSNFGIIKVTFSGQQLSYNRNDSTNSTMQQSVKQL